MALAADQEQHYIGFWPGNSKFPAPAFAAYTYPEPPGCRDATIEPDAAFYHLDSSEFIPHYDNVRLGGSADQQILDFHRTTYKVGASLGGWDRASLKRPELLIDPLGRPASR